jgi:transposase InsO family protein
MSSGAARSPTFLREYGVDPAPERDKHMPWSTFLRAQRECLVATDFLTVEVCTIRALVTHYVLCFIDIVNRAVKIAGITPHPDSRWMTQIARNLTDLNDGFLRGKRYLILDRDTKYSDAFRSVLVREGIQVVRLPARSPNLNAFAERFVRSIKEECLSRMIFFATERNHQGLENRIPQPMSVAALPHHPVQRRQRLGGMLSSAQAFFRKALASTFPRVPRKVTLDGHVPSRRALWLLRREHPCWRNVKVRTNKYLNNLIEQDHRAIKRRCASMAGFKSFKNAAITIAGIELAHRIRKRQFSFGRGRRRRDWCRKTEWAFALA